MIMSEFEIMRTYEQAKHPEQQVKILSLVNCISRDAVMEIIQRKQAERAKKDREYNELYEKAKENTPSQNGSYRKEKSLV